MTSNHLPDDLSRLHPDRWTLPFWEASAEHRLVCQFCVACEKPRTPPALLCWNCQSSQSEWRELPGSGRIYSYVVTHHPILPSLAESVPFVSVLVELDGAPGARLPALLTDSLVEDIEIGQLVQVDWEEISEATVLPRFRVTSTVATS
jgi:uncharacterized protein